MANGEISFFGNPVSLNVNEPNNGQISNISLLVMRDGVSGSATVRWRLIPTTNTLTMADVSPWNGTIYFPPGTHCVANHHSLTDQLILSSISIDLINVNNLDFFHILRILPPFCFHKFHFHFRTRICLKYNDNLQ